MLVSYRLATGRNGAGDGHAASYSPGLASQAVRMQIGKCPLAANVAAAYAITEQGIVPAEHVELPPLPLGSVLDANIHVERAFEPE